MKATKKTKTHGKRTPKATEALLPPPEQRGLAAYAPELSAYDAATAPASAVRVPIDMIDVPPEMERLPLDMEEVRSQAATIRVGGLVNPISLRPKPNGRYELVAGRHRRAAHELIGLKDVLSLIRGDWDNQGALVARAVENLRRRKVGPYEEALGYRDMHEAGMTPGQVATACNVSEARVKARLKLLALPPDVGARLGSPEVPLAHADVLLQLVPHADAFAVAKKLMGKLDFDGRPLTAHGFGDLVAMELRHKRLVQDLTSLAARTRLEAHARFRKDVAKLPKVTLGRTAFCMDPKGYRKLAQPYVVKDREARVAAETQRAKETAERPATKAEDWQERQRRQSFTEAYYAHEHATRIVKAAKGVVGIDGVLRLLVQEAVSGVTREVDYDRAATLLADVLGTSPSDLLDVFGQEGKAGAAAQAQFVDRLVTSEDHLGLARFLATAALLRLEARWGPEWPSLAQIWLNVDAKGIVKDAERAYRTWVKTGAVDPLPGQEAPDECNENHVPTLAAPPAEVAQEG